jgi:UDPglucose 6-dehydrogenase
MEALLNAGCTVVAYDPVAIERARKHFQNKIGVQFVESPYVALEGADALCIATEWKQFREPNFEKMKKLMKSPVVFDGRNLYRLDTMKKSGFTYYSIGRQVIS